MTRPQKLLRLYLELLDLCREPAIQDFTACLFALVGLALVAELMLGMFGR